MVESSGVPSEVKTLSNDQVTQICKTAMQKVDVKDRSYRFRTYKQCFLGSDLVKWFQQNYHAKDEFEAVELGQRMLQQSLLFHVCKDHDFKNQKLFYRFSEHSRDQGHAADENDTWHKMLEVEGVLKDHQMTPDQLKSILEGKSDFPAKNTNHLPHVLFDEHNCDLLDAVRPINWVDPKAHNKYDIIAIGGGAGGLVTAAGAAGVGAKAALIERNMLGGDCLNTGCVPSKAFLKCCNVAHTARNSEQFGVTTGEVKIDFPKIMQRMRKIRAEISENDSAARFSKSLGVDVFLGEAKFVDKNTIEVNGQKLSFLKAVIATGGRPNVPDTEGLQTVPYFTSDSIFNLTIQPKKMVIVGAGPIGCELGQGFQRLGTEVTFLSRGKQFLPREDSDASALLADQMKRDGCQFHFGATPCKYELVKSREESEDGLPRIKITYKIGDEEQSMEVDTVLLATGRVPNVENIGCEDAGVKFDLRDGIIVDKNLQSSNKDVFAVGDCCSRYQFTHNSDVHARSVVRNALFFGSVDRTKILLPWATYTEPEIAHVGKYGHELKAEGVEFDTFTKFYDRCDRAICESRTNGFMKIHVKKGSDVMLGATIVGGPAGDMICQITASMHNGIGLAKMGQCVYPYPTYAEGLKHLSDQFNRTKLTPAARSLIRGLLEIRQ